MEQTVNNVVFLSLVKFECLKINKNTIGVHQGDVRRPFISDASSNILQFSHSILLYSILLNEWGKM